MRTTDGNIIRVAMTLYDKNGDYSQHVGATLASLFEHTQSRVIIYLLHDDTLTDNNKIKFERLAENYRQAIKFINIGASLKIFAKSQLARLDKLSWSRAVLYRLLVPDMLSDVDKVIYLDGDLIINLDISELWQVDLAGKLIGAVRDYLARNYTFWVRLAEKLRLSLIKSDLQTQINAGVLLMDLRGIRERFNLLDEAARWFERYGHQATFNDQDFIASFFGGLGAIKFLDAKFNKLACDPEATGNGEIIHLINRFKPWQAPQTAFAELYWQNYFRTPWADGVTPDDVAGKLIGLARTSPMSHGRLRQCWGEILFALRCFILRRTPVRILLMLKILLTELRFRLGL